MRNGATLKVCSYAYDEVQDYMVSQLVGFMDYGFDGVSLIFHRGAHIGFEEPVIRRFAELYPDVDPFVLPAADERLNGVWSDFMTTFMRKLRNALDAASDRHLKINVITDYTPATSKLFGLDVERWAKEHLIDQVLQTIMETFEDLDGCLNQLNRGRELLRDICRTALLIVSAEDLSEEERSTIRAAGYVIWETDEEITAGSWTELSRRLDTEHPNQLLLRCDENAEDSLKRIMSNLMSERYELHQVLAPMLQK
jgi:hypothetical protein